ncbi:hypothetical protein PanWU01x14_012270, partial [Parasponia andersonii]
LNEAKEIGEGDRYKHSSIGLDDHRPNQPVCYQFARGQNERPTRPTGNRQPI